MKFLKDKYFSIGDSYLKVEGSEKAIEQFHKDIQNRKFEYIISSKSSSTIKPPVKLTKKNVKKFFK